MSDKSELIYQNYGRFHEILKRTSINEETIEFAINYKPKDFDRFLVTYPKCGTSWTQQIIHLIISGGDLNGIWNSDKTPFFDNNFLEGLEPDVMKVHMNNEISIQSNEGFVWKTHLCYELLPFNESAKYLLVLRNPKDCLVSYYYFALKYLNISLDFHQFFKYWISGYVVHGDYFTHVKQYWIHCKNEQNFTILLYEEMNRDIKQSIETISQFLGQKYVNRLSNDDKLMDQIIEKSNIKSMKEIYKNESFVRKGVVGDWRSHLTKDESDLIDKRVEEEWMGTGLELLWKEEMKWIEK